MFQHVPPQQPASVPCKICFVGEAPSGWELRRGKPFVGPSGRVFDQLLRVAGIDRVECLVTNVFDEQLPGNNVSAWCAAAPERGDWVGYDLPPIGDAGWLRPERTWHLARLRDELLAVSPTLVIPLGGTALWALSGSASLGERRGATFAAARLLPGVKLLPMYHPTYVIQDWRWFHVGVADLVKAKRECEFPEVRHTPIELWVEPTLEDLATFQREYLDGASLIAIDIETAGGEITCVGFGADETRAITVPFSDLRKPDRSYWATLEEEQEAWAWVRKVCGNSIPKLLQNGLFDSYWLWRRNIPIVNYRHDTRLLHHALYPELPKSLSFMGSSYANRPAWKTMREKASTKRDE
jgi:uracil-DNA glycosylase